MKKGKTIDPLGNFTHVRLENDGMTPAALMAAATGDFENAIVASTPGGIEAQEKAGQMKQATLETLPIDMQGCTVKDFEKLGFVFGDKTDRIFWQCSFPKGWTKRPTDHSMWSDLLDDKGRKRGSIFFKAAFYDYSAHIGLNPRYHVKSTYLDKNGEEIYDRATGGYRKGKERSKDDFIRYDVVDTATNETIFSTGHLPTENWDRREEALARCKAKDEAKARAAEWLKSKFPNCNEPAVYWD